MITKFPEAYDKETKQIVKIDDDFYHKTLEYRNKLDCVYDQNAKLTFSAAIQQSPFMYSALYLLLSDLTRVSTFFKSDKKIQFNTATYNFTKTTIAKKRLGLKSEDPVLADEDYDSIIDLTRISSNPNINFCQIVKIPHNFELVLDYIEELHKTHSAEIIKYCNEEEQKSYNLEPLKRLTILEKAFKVNPSDKIRIFKNGNNYIIFTDTISFDLGIKIIGAIPILFKECTIQEDIIELFMQVGLNDVQKTFEALDKAIEKIDLRALSISKALNNIPNISTKNQIKMVEKSIERENNIIADFKRQVETCYMKIIKLNNELIVLQNSKDTLKEELTAFISKCKNIKTINSSYTNQLDLTVSSELSNWDPEAVKCIMNMADRMQENYELTSLKNKFIKWFLKQLLEKETISMEFWNQIRLTWDRDYMHPNVVALSSVLKEHLPNPHLYHYNCWGQNIDVTVKLLSECKYDLAFTQIIATVGMLNLYDTAVTRSFIKDLDEMFAGKDAEYFYNTVFTDTKTNKKLTVNDVLNRYKEETKDGKEN